jgi:hypothetical protein
MKILDLFYAGAVATLVGVVTVAGVNPAYAQTQNNSGFASGTQANSNSSVSGVSSSTNNTTVQGQLQGNNQALTINNPAETTVRYQGGYELKNVPGVVAPNLTTTLTETCMGSTSIGGAGVGFGFSAGTTWKDTDCVNRLNARELRTFGDTAAAKEVMCENEVVRAAYKRVGQPCALRDDEMQKVVVNKPVVDGFGKTVKTSN